MAAAHSSLCSCCVLRRPLFDVCSLCSELWPAKRFKGGQGTAPAVAAVYNKYNVECTLYAQASTGEAARLAAEAWPEYKDADFIGLCMPVVAVGGHTNFGLQWERLLAEMRSRGVAHIIAKKRAALAQMPPLPYPSSPDLLDVAEVDPAGALNLNQAVFRLVCTDLEDTSITAGIEYRLVRLQLFMNQMFSMAFDLLQANHETPSTSPEFRTQVLRRIGALITRWVGEYLRQKLFDTQQLMRDGAFRSYTLNLVLNAPSFIGFAVPVAHVPLPAGPGLIPPLPPAPVVPDSSIATQMKLMAKLALNNPALQVSVTDFVAAADADFDKARTLYGYLWNYAKFQIAMDLEKEMRIYPYAFLHSGTRCRAQEIYPFLIGDISRYEQTRQGAVRIDDEQGDDDDELLGGAVEGEDEEDDNEQDDGTEQRQPQQPQEWTNEQNEEEEKYDGETADGDDEKEEKQAPHPAEPRTQLARATVSGLSLTGLGTNLAGNRSAANGRQGASSRGHHAAGHGSHNRTTAARPASGSAESVLYYDQSMFRPLPAAVPARNLFDAFAFNTNHAELSRSRKQFRQDLRNLHSVVATLERTRQALFNMQTQQVVSG